MLYIFSFFPINFIEGHQPTLIPSILEDSKELGVEAGLPGCMRDSSLIDFISIMTAPSYLSKRDGHGVFMK
jgi:hypothetical protein